MLSLSGRLADDRVEEANFATNFTNKVKVTFPFVTRPALGYQNVSAAVLIGLPGGLPVH